MPLSDSVQQVPESILGMDLNQAVFHSRGWKEPMGLAFTADWNESIRAYSGPVELLSSGILQLVGLCNQYVNETGCTLS